MTQPTRPILLQADARHLPLASRSVHFIMTSPPYFALRSYSDASDPLKPLECGSEETPAEFVSNMMTVFDEARRVLRDDGVCVVNIGETWAAAGAGAAGKELAYQPERAGREARTPPPGTKAGDMIGVPFLFAFAMRERGWYWRDTLVWCLAQSTIVYAKTATTVGPMSLHDLVRLDPSTVQLWTGEKWSPVLGWSSSECEKPIRLTLRSGETINCTPNHRWPLVDGSVVRADELKIGDVLTSCRLPEQSNSEGDGIPEDLAWFAGLYLAEGCRSGQGLAFAGHSKEWQRHERVSTIARRYGGTSTIRTDGDTVTQTVHGHILVGAVEHFVGGRNAKTKHLNPRCWRANNATLEAFLRGYLDGDGHFDPGNARWRLGFCRNNAWASDLRCLCARLGWKLTLSPTFSSMGRGRKFESYRGEIRFSSSGHHNCKERAEIVKIESDAGGAFYDIGIADEPHLFSLASGILTHNSKPSAMPASLSGWRWRQCRVKMKKSTRSAAGHKHAEANAKAQSARAGKDFINDTDWSDCPGCPKCLPNGGLVLRKGSLRSTTAHEYLFIFTKSSRYYGDREGWATPAKAATLSRNKYTRIVDDPHEQFAVRHDHESIGATANLRSVLSVGAEPQKAKHYACYPSKLVVPFIKAFTSERGVCPCCGAPWARVVMAAGSTQQRHTPGPDQYHTRANGRHGATSSITTGEVQSFDTLGWRPTCACPAAAPIPATVFDPFSGTARTGVAALRLGRRYIGTDLYAKYLHIARHQLDNALNRKPKASHAQELANPDQMTIADLFRPSKEAV